MSRWFVALAALAIGCGGAILFNAAPFNSAVAADPEESLAESLPRVPPIEPADALASFSVLPGFHLEQVAAEPLVRSPVAMAFDARGRLYVIEMCDYSEQEHEFLGDVRVLEDTDGDGRYDKSEIFAEHLSWPTAIACYDGGVFVGAPDILYLKDTNGDGKADVRKVAFTGFERTNVQGLLNSFQWGFDSRIYGATSSSGGKITCPEHPNRPAINARGRDFSFDPKTLDFRLESGGAQHGLTFDDWGRRFVCSNSDHLQMIMVEDRYANRNPTAPMPPPRLSIAADGPQAAVFRVSPVEAWRVIRSQWRASGRSKGKVEGGGAPAGYFTGATGVTIYRGDAYPAEFHGQAFVGDAGSNLVHRKTLEPAGVPLLGKRVDQGREIIASKDIWFRPVQFGNAPDGTLYILDMYRETIEHPKAIPEEIKKYLDLTSGRERGRIYRLAPDGFKEPSIPKLDTATTSELAAALESRNGWTRDTAARLLYEKSDPATAAALLPIAQSKLPEARIVAISLLHTLGALPETALIQSLGDDNPRVREHAILLAEETLLSKAGAKPTERSALTAKLCGMTDDADARVRYQLALSLASVPVGERVPALAKLAAANLDDRWIEAAVFNSLSEGADQALKLLVANPKVNSTPAGCSLLTNLARQIATGGAPTELQVAEQCVISLESDHTAAASAIVRGLAEAPRRRGKPKAELSPRVKESLARILKASRSLAQDETRPAGERIEAVRALSLGPFGESRDALVALLSPATPQTLQIESIHALGKIGDDSIAPLLMTAWPGMSPQVRSAAADALFSRPVWITGLLTAVEQGTIPLVDIEPNRLKMLERFPVKAVRAQAKLLLDKMHLGKRDDVVAEYLSAMKSLTGDADRGKKLFQGTCSACHQLEGVGATIGPNLATFANRGPEAIVLNVIDPNREVNPQFFSYQLIDSDGRPHSGIITSENDASVTLLKSGAVTETILRSEIDGPIQNSGQSLMPEGLEKLFDHQAMADIVAYILSQK